MAKRGSSKDLSEQHETFVAKRYSGTRSKSSGGADNDQGDVRTEGFLIECKMTGKPGKPARSKLVQQFEKIAEEAWSEGKEPMLALRWYDPDSILADSFGWIDLIVRRVADDT